MVHADGELKAVSGAPRLCVADELRARIQHKHIDRAAAGGPALGARPDRGRAAQVTLGGLHGTFQRAVLRLQMLLAMKGHDHRVSLIATTSAVLRLQTRHRARAVG